MSKINDLSGNAILAKSRAMYGKALTAEDYKQLVNCRTINELVTYLKNHTDYQQAMSSDTNIHYTRARVEAAIKKYSYSRTASLAAFDSAIGQKINRVVYLDYEKNLILNCSYHLDTAKVSDFSLFTPPSFFRHSQLNPAELEKSTDFIGFCNALSGTEYHALMSSFISGNIPFGIQALEDILNRYFYSEIKKIINENYSGKAKQELLELFMMQSDFKMFESIYRTKKYFSDESAGSVRVTPSPLSALSINETNSLVYANDIEDFFKKLKATKYGNLFDEKYKNNFELYTGNAMIKHLKKQLRFSDVPEKVMFCYIALARNETNNIIHIIEGIRYSLAPEKISEFLILTDD